MATLGRILVGVALILALLGLLLLVLDRLGVTRLPGDIVWRRGRVTVYLPIGLMILLSLVLTLLLNLLLRR